MGGPLRLAARLPHCAAAFVGPLLRPAIDLHLGGFSPGNRAVQQTNIASSSAEIAGSLATGSGGAFVGGVIAAQNWPVLTVGRKSALIAVRPVIHIRDEHQRARVSEPLRRKPLPTAPGNGG